MKTYIYKISKNNLKDIIDFSIFENEKNILVQIFCGQGVKVLKNTLEVIMNNIPNVACIGTTTDGEIFNKKITTHKTIISISVFSKTTIKISYVKGINSFKNGTNLAKSLITSNTKLLILFTDGTRTNGEDFLNGIESFNNKVIVSGGMAGDNALFEKTFISSQGTIISHGAIGVSLNSDSLYVDTAYEFGWKPIGLEYCIDKVEGNRVYSIGGMLPSEFYFKHLGESVVPMEFPLVFRKNGILVARVVLHNHKDGSFSFSGNLRQGEKVRLSFGDVDTLMNDFDNLYNKFLYHNVETFFIYSCMARRRYIKYINKLESRLFASIAPTSGFFTYAEFFHKDNHNELFNQTFTIISLSESSKTHNKKNKFRNILKSKKYYHYANTMKSLTHLISQSTKDIENKSITLQKKETHLQTILNVQKEFLKYTVHETNTFLSIISHNIELYTIKNKENKYFNNILIALKNLSSVYNDLNYMIKRNHIKYLKHKIDLMDHIKNRIDFFTPFAKKTNLTFIFESQLKVAFINFNETKLQRIIDNNITNAIKYTYENENIYIVLRKKSNKYSFLIYSHSRKIQHPSNIFKEYYREEKIHYGFGLGLNLVKKICDDENINIYFRSSEKFTLFKYVFNE
jgi:hypothetical protein